LEEATMRSSTQIVDSPEVSTVEALLGIAFLAGGFVVMVAEAFDAVASLETALYSLELGL
jgi:hypothetical protein